MTNREKFNKFVREAIEKYEDFTNDQLIDEVYRWDSWFSGLFFLYIEVVKGKATSKLNLIEWLDHSVDDYSLDDHSVDD